ncbi:MAG: hypothetical protein ABSH28_12760, partial [Acidobacteriota bacterium]
MILPEIVKSHPYLFTNVLSLGLVLISAIHLPPACRRLILRLGLIMMLSSTFALLFEREYWHPIRAGGWALGIEDLLFTFDSGALGCLPAIWFFRRNLVVAEQPAPKIVRLLGVAMMSLCWLTVIWLMGLSKTTSILLAHIMTAVSLRRPRFDLWALGLANGA